MTERGYFHFQETDLAVQCWLLMRQHVMVADEAACHGDQSCYDKCSETLQPISEIFRSNVKSKTDSAQVTGKEQFIHQHCFILVWCVGSAYNL